MNAPAPDPVPHDDIDVECIEKLGRLAKSRVDHGGTALLASMWTMLRISFRTTIRSAISELLL
jgi:hypothetical protein